MQAQANWENQLLALAGTTPHPQTRPFFSYWAGDVALRKAYKQAEMITSQHSRSFYLASGLLPEEKRVQYLYKTLTTRQVQQFHRRLRRRDLPKETKWSA